MRALDIPVVRSCPCCQDRTWTAVSLQVRVRGWVERRLNRTRTDRFGFDGRRDR